MASEMPRRIPTHLSAGPVESRLHREGWDGDALVLERKSESMEDDSTLFPSPAPTLVEQETIRRFRRIIEHVPRQILGAASQALAKERLDVIAEVREDLAVVAILPSRDVDKAQRRRHAFSTHFPGLFGPVDSPVAYYSCKSSWQRGKNLPSFHPSDQRELRRFDTNVLIDQRYVWIRSDAKIYPLIVSGSLFAMSDGATAILENVRVAVERETGLSVDYHVHLMFAVGLGSRITAGEAPYELSNLSDVHQVWRRTGEFEPHGIFEGSKSNSAERRL